MDELSTNELAQNVLTEWIVNTVPTASKVLMLDPW